MSSNKVSPMLPGSVPGKVSDFPGHPETRARADLGPTSPQGSPERGSSKLVYEQAAEHSVQTPEMGKTTQDERNLDNYIPFRLAFLRECIIADFPDIFQQNETKAKFFRLCKWLALRNSMKLAIMFEEINDVYSFIDPDGGVENVDATSLQVEEKEAYFTRFIQIFSDVMEKGDFDPISQEFLDRSYEEQSTSTGGFLGTGLEVKPIDTNIIDFKLWYRGKVTSTVNYRTWRNLWRMQSQTFHTFDRLVVMFRRRPEAHIQERERLNKASLYERVVESCYDFILRQGKQSMSMDDGLKPGMLYLKVFKTVAHTDIDMLMPGAEAKFTWLDYAIIWGSILFAIGFAAYKAASGTLKFDTYLNIGMALLLIVMPLYGAFNGYMSIKQKIQNLQSHLNGLYIMHNLSSNNGAIAQVLDEALEQEDKETVLAYFFLWCGLKTPKPMTRVDLDKSVEKFLAELLGRGQVATAIDFEVTDALEKLRQMGILEDCDDKECKLFKVLPLDQAVEAAHINKFNEDREVTSVRQRKRALGPVGPVWQECIDTFPETGQKFRFFWNLETGESTYTVPAAYIPLQDPSLGLYIPSSSADPQKGL